MTPEFDPYAPLLFMSFTGAIIRRFESIEDLLEEFQPTFDKPVQEELGQGEDGKLAFTIYVGDKIFGWARYIE
jgi:hypothetical protein